MNKIDSIKQICHDMESDVRYDQDGNMTPTGKALYGYALRLESVNDNMNRGIAHLHEEIESKSGAYVDVNGVRYECAPAVKQEIERLYLLLANWSQL